MIKIITPFKIKEKLISDAIEKYTKYIKPYSSITHVEIAVKSRSKNSLEIIKSHTAHIKSYIEKVEGYKILLDRKGELFDNFVLTKILKKFYSHPGIYFIIGGPYGVDVKELSSYVDKVWSLSPLIFSHEIVYLILLEQIFRSFAIIHNHPYHFQYNFSFS